jgi:hypothetical protein
MLEQAVDLLGEECERKEKIEAKTKKNKEQ